MALSSSRASARTPVVGQFKLTHYPGTGSLDTPVLIARGALRTSALRTLGGLASAFESFIDELAAAAGVDPVAFREAGAGLTEEAIR